MVSEDHIEQKNFSNEERLLKEEVEEGVVSEVDAQAIREFINEEDMGNNKLTTVRTHHANLRTAARRSDIPLVECSVDDLNSLLSRMRSGTHPDVKDDGIGVSNYQKVFRVFYRYHSKYGVDPEEIEIDKEEGRRLRADDLLFQDDVDALLSACYELRDRALLSMGLATGQRIDALRTLRNKHITITGQTMDITLNEDDGALKGASGKKPLLWSKHYVKSWYDHHPYKEDPNAALFCPMPDAPLPDDRDPRGPLHYQTILDKINRIAKRAYVAPNKRVYPHLLRHSAITRMMLEGLSEQKIKQVVGWSPDSSQFSTYITLTDDLTNDSIREDLGLPTSGEKVVVGRPTLQECPECGDRLPEEPDYCKTCNVPLTTYEAVEGDYDVDEVNPDAIVEDMDEKQMLELIKSVEKKLTE